MKAMITGASSGIGKEIARYLDDLGYDLILVARDKEKLVTLQKELKNQVKIIVIDLSNVDKVKDLYLLTRGDNVDILVNNAGFGLFGECDSTDALKEIEMINVNCIAVQFLTKMFLKDFIKRNSGYILNVGSSAGLLKGGPLMSTYYATKSFVVSYSNAIAEELRKKKSNVHISCLCPGPVKTNFNNVAGVSFTVPSLSASYVAKYSIDKMFKNKTVIVPGFMTRIGLFFTRFLSTRFIVKITYMFQKMKK